MRRAAGRLAGLETVDLSHADFMSCEPAGRRFDLITFVASLHHMPLRPALERARDLLRPNGLIAVVGLSANKTVRDWLWSAMCLRAVRVASALHHKVRDIGVHTSRPRESLDRDPSRRRRRAPWRVHSPSALLPLSDDLAQRGLKQLT